MYKFFKCVDKYLGGLICLGLFVFDRLFLLRKKRPKELKKHKRVLVIKLVALGDLILALPTISAIKNQIKDVFLCVLTTKRTEEFLMSYKNKIIDELIIYDIFGEDKGIMGFINLIKRIKRYKFDTCLDLDHYYRLSGIISYFSSAAERVGFALKNDKDILYTKKVKYMIDKHEVEIFYQQANAILGGGDVSSQIKLIPLPISYEDKQYVDNLLKLKNIKGRFIVIHPGTSGTAISRRWGLNNYAVLIKLIKKEFNLDIILTGTSQDRKELEFLEEEGVLNLAGELTLVQFAALVSRAGVFVSSDTGVMHLSSAMSVPVVAMFGPNTPQKWGPYKTQNRVLYKNYPCSPCIKQYRGIIYECKRPRCMQAITPQEVFDAIKSLLSP